jgi:hypothetical protein
VPRGVLRGRWGVEDVLGGPGEGVVGIVKGCRAVAGGGC